MYKGEESYKKIIEFMKKKDFMFGQLKEAFQIKKPVEESVRRYFCK